MAVPNDRLQYIVFGVAIPLDFYQIVSVQIHIGVVFIESKVIYIVIYTSELTISYYFTRLQVYLLSVF